MIDFRNKRFDEAEEDVLCQLLSKRTINNPPEASQFFKEHTKAYLNYCKFLHYNKKKTTKKTQVYSLYEEHYSFFYEKSNHYIGQLFSLEREKDVFTLNESQLVEGLQMIALISRKNGYSVAIESMEHRLSKDSWKRFIKCCEVIFEKQLLTIYYQTERLSLLHF